MTATEPLIEVLTAKNNQPTARVHLKEGRAVWLHSAYDPGREAASLVAKHPVKQAGAVIVLGLGLGHHVVEVMQQTDGDVPVLVVEADGRMIGLARKHNRSLSWENFTLATNEQELKAFLVRHREHLRRGTPTIIEHPVSVRLNPLYYAKMRERIRDYVSVIVVELATGKVLNRCVQKNLLRNLPLLVSDPGVGSLAGVFLQRPAVIVSAGPSLSKNIDLVAEARNRGVIICVGTSLKAMLGKGILPDLVATLDPTEANYRLFSGLHAEGIFLCYEPQTHFAIPPLFEGRRFVFNCFDNPLQTWLKETCGHKGYVEPGGSVAIAAFGIACLLGCNPIVFIGQDLAFTGGFTHARGTVYEGQRVGAVEGRLEYLKVPSVDGGTVWTSRALHGFLVRFKELFAQYSDRLIIDATEGGALMRGTKVMTFREALDTYFTEEVPALEIIAAKHREASQPRPEIEVQVRGELEKTLSEYRAWLPRVDKVVSTARGIANMAETIHVFPRETSGDRFAAGLARHLREEAVRLNALLKEANKEAKLIDLLSLLTFDAHLAKGPEDGAPLLDQVQHILKMYSSYQAAIKTMIGQLEETLAALAAEKQEYPTEGAVNQ